MHTYKPQNTPVHTLKTTVHQRSRFRKNVHSSPVTIISLLRIRSVQHAVKIRQRQVADNRVQFIDFFVTLLIPGSFLVQIHSQSSVECNLKMQLTRTFANSNLALTRTKIDFRLIFFSNFTLCEITRTLDNNNLPLTRSNFYFPSDHFYIILPSITRAMFQGRGKSKKKNVYCSPKHWIYLKTSMSIA